MKKIMSFLGLTILLLCSSCAYPGQPSLADSVEPVNDRFDSILDSYYAFNDTDAYRLITSSALNRFLNHWTDDSIVNPVWNYDSFTKYEGEDLYYCTFTDDNDKHFYMVLRYDAADGGGLGKVRSGETPYSYDLKSNLEEIKDKLSETDLDLSSTVASRAQLVAKDQNRSAEVILFTDDHGNQYACHLDTFEMIKI